MLKQVKRTFVGIAIHPGHTFLEQVDALKKEFSDEKISWTHPENFHITLHFFGNIPEPDVGLIKEILGETVLHVKSFHFQVRGAGIFTNLNHPRVLWLGLQETGELTELRNELENHLALQGFKSDSRAFRPHLTLGRMKKLNHRVHVKETLEKYDDLKFFEAPAGEIIFYESVLTEKGVVYHSLSHHDLMKS